MSNAHYQALELQQPSDEDNDDIERRHHHRTTTIPTRAPYSKTRKGSVSVSRRLCLLPLVGGVLFFLVCYLTFSMDTRLALGLGGGSEDSEEGSHHGLGKLRVGVGLAGVRENVAARKTKARGLHKQQAFAIHPKFKRRQGHRVKYEFPKLKQNVSEEFELNFGSKPEFWNLQTINFRPLNETLHICSENFEDRRLFLQDKPRSDFEKLPIIYFVTPTYPRREQIPELTRLAHTLLHVPRLHWLVADDQEKCNGFLDTLLERFGNLRLHSCRGFGLLIVMFPPGIPFTHMVSPMPSKFRNEKPAPRGVANRRAALQWIRQHNLTNGVLYFGDDDNTYDLRLFSEIRQTQRVSMFPVGLIADYGVSGPVVRKGKVVAFLDSWVAGRRWPVDMAGFAVNLEYMAQYPYVNMPYKPGYEEDLFLRSIGLRMDLIEPRGSNCTEILVWHTQTKSKKIGGLRMENKYLDDRSNLGALFRNLKRMGVAIVSDSEGKNALISKNGKEKAHALILS
ncbi:hypothetical protein KR009_007325 [Drosophila setifemur]|nr:hypothetical protein KR009_007325 [Drosophila setifemur]